MDNTRVQIRQSEKNFDLNGSEDETLYTISAMTGEQFGFSESERNGNGNDMIPLAEAAEIMQFRQTKTWQRMEVGIQGIYEDAINKTRNEKLSRDERGAALDAARGIEKVQLFIASIFADATTKFQNLTGEEKLMLGPAGMRITQSVALTAAAEAIKSPVPGSSKHYTADETQQNTKAMIASFEAEKR